MSKRRADGTTILKPGQEADLSGKAARGDMGAVDKLKQAGIGAVPVRIAPLEAPPPEPSAPMGQGRRRRTMKKRKSHRRKTHHRRR